MIFGKKVIDSHMHLYNWFGSDGRDFMTEIDDFRKKFGIHAVNLCAIPVYANCDVSNNIMCALYKLHDKTAYASGGFVYPELPAKLPLPEGMDALTQYNELMEIGFDGMKFIESKPQEFKALNLPFTDGFYKKFFEKAEKDETPIVWHVADPDTFWDRTKIPERFIERGWFYGDGTYPPLERVYGDVFYVLDKHPELKVQFAHFFFWSEYPGKLEELFGKYENVNVDIVPGAEMYDSFNNNYEFYREFFEKHADRIVYGTDVSFTAGDPKYSMEHYSKLNREIYDAFTTDRKVSIYTAECKGLNLSDEALDKILYGNFIKAHTPEPKQINKAALKKYIEKYNHLINDGTIKSEILKYAETL